MSTSFPILSEMTLTLVLGTIPPSCLYAVERYGVRGKLKLNTEGAGLYSPLGGTGGGREGGLSGDWMVGSGGSGKDVGQGFLS